MRKLYLAALGGLIASSAIAQQPVIDRISVPTISKKDLALPTKAVDTYYLDYEGYDQGTASDYKTYIEWVHSYDPDPNDLRYAIQTFDTLVLTPDYTSYSTLGYDVVTNMVVDSIFFRFHHRNASGMPDSIVVEIVTLTGLAATPAGSYRPTNTVLWDTAIVSTTSLSDPSSPTGFPINLMELGPYFTLPSTSERYGIKISFNAPVQDSFALIYGFPFDPNTACANPNIDLTNDFGVLQVSPFYPNAYYQVTTAAGATSALVPSTTGNGFWYFDCNNNNAADWPQENGYQNWSIWSKMTITDNVSVGEIGNTVASLSSMPNPAADVATIKYVLQQNANVTLNVYDMTGKNIISRNEGTKTAGANTMQLDVSQLPAGVYYYTVGADNSRLSNKMVIVK